MRTASIDLNLLAALHALLAERNVTRAGRRIGLSQPAMSEALGRLRRHFDDELLTRVGNSYELTPLGAGLRATSAAAMELVEQTFAAAQGFDPGSCEREFVLFASDYAAAVLGPPLMKAIQRASPLTRLRLDQLPPDEAPDVTLTATHSLDGLLLPRGTSPSGMSRTTLFHDRWVCLISADNPAAAQPLTVETLAALPWVVPAAMRVRHPVFADLRARGLEPKARFVVGGFQLLPEMVRDSDHICLIQERLAARVAAPDLRVLELPWELPPVVETLWWHPAHTHDPSHRWLRELAVTVGHGLDAALPHPPEQDPAGSPTGADPPPTGQSCAVRMNPRIPSQPGRRGRSAGA